MSETYSALNAQGSGVYRCVAKCNNWLQVTCPKGHLSEMLNVPVQIPKFDAKPNPKPSPNPNSNPNRNLALTLTQTLTLQALALTLTLCLYFSDK